MDKNALLYYKTANALKFLTEEADHIAGFFIKMSKKSFFFRGGDTPFNCTSSSGVANNKYCMNKMLERAGFPVPKATAFNRDQFSSEKLEFLIRDLSFPLVIKPTIGTSCGLDVLCNIGSMAQLRVHLEKAFRKYMHLSVEEFHANLNSYRVLVFYNKVIGVVQRFSARVEGDGIHTLKELIALQNVEREKLDGIVSLGPIKVDEEYVIRLKELNITLNMIPREKETIILCYTCNSTRGGTMTSLGKKIGKENARLLCEAANTLDLNLVGFDVACEDILTPISRSKGVIIEANHNPDISIHERPMFGIQNRVSKIILSRLIFRHPFSYMKGFYQSMSPLYCRFALLIFWGLTYKLFLL